MQQHIPGGAVDLSGLIGGAATPSGGPAQPETPAAQGDVVEVPSLVFDAGDDTFEQVSNLSQVVPVVLLLESSRQDTTSTLASTLGKLVREMDGRIVLARIDIDTNPGLARALQVQAVPTTVALVTGQPVPLFQGEATEEQIRQIIQQLLQLGAQQGLPGRVKAQSNDEPAEPEEPQINPAHLAAVEAIEKGDYATAITEYEQVLARAPRDTEAADALAQVKLLHRLSGVSMDAARKDAAEQPQNVDAQLVVADLDVSGGHVDDAFNRLLELFASADDDDRTRIQEHLLELFAVVGVTDSRVVQARGRLANMLF